MNIGCCACVVLAVFVFPAGIAAAEPTLLFDFCQGMHGWSGNPRIDNMQQVDEGLYFESTGIDPWIESPPIEAMPLGDRVRITLRLRSSGDRSGELFFGSSFSPERQRSFTVNPDGAWHEYSVLLPPQEPGARLRLDPARDQGTYTLAWIKAEPVRPLITPDFAPPSPPEFSGSSFEISSGSLSFAHNGRDWDGYTLTVDGALMASGHVEAFLGIMVDGAPVRLPLRGGEGMTLAVETKNNALTMSAAVTDPGGGHWTLRRTAAPGPLPGALCVRTSIVVDADRELYHVPWATVFPGLGAFGAEKTQALLPGVEYLENEPSSSEADFNAEQADRRIVEDFKLTLPMMILQHQERYVGLLWRRADHPAAIFDSPDRVFHSGAHLMGLWHPAVGDLRLENEFSVYGVFPIRKNEALEMEFLFLGGNGRDITPAMKQYLALRGLPTPPEFEGGFDRALRLLAKGWLDSALHEDGLWRHAVWGDSFGPVAAADAPAFMLWLAAHSNDSQLAARLKDAAERGLSRLDPPDNFTASVGHVTRPLPPLLFGDVAVNVDRMTAAARSSLARFDADGLLRYRQSDPNKPDYGRTHFADHANGLHAQALETILNAAAFSGDQELIREGLRLLEEQTRHYANTVPRGAQTWEMPLHTPDILGAARLIRTYVLGYLLSGKADYLGQARYWAWTGMPFLYLDRPVEAPVGAFASIAVLGATNWIAPNWVGLPVQWCGLVYRSALHDLARIDQDNGPLWDEAARGITLSGLQQLFPLDDEARQGLLPDFFHLQEQLSDGPAINPGTLQAHLPELYGMTPYYSVVRISEDNALLHAPGAVSVEQGQTDVVRANIKAWPESPYWLRATQLPEDAVAIWNNNAPRRIEFDAARGAMNILVEGSGTLEIKGIRPLHAP